MPGLTHGAGMLLIVPESAENGSVFRCTQDLGLTGVRKERGMKELRILFVCTHNGARSRIAEEFAKRAAFAGIEVYSASFEAEGIGPLPVAVMEEVGIVLPTFPPKSVFDRFKEKESFNYVVAICDPASNEQVPVFLASVDSLYKKTAQCLTWHIPNFRSLSGTPEEKKAGARKVRDQIEIEVINFLSQLGLESNSQ
jgi:arsenate reductase